MLWDYNEKVSGNELKRSSKFQKLGRIRQAYTTDKINTTFCKEQLFSYIKQHIIIVSEG